MSFLGSRGSGGTEKGYKALVAWLGVGLLAVVGGCSGEGLILDPNPSPGASTIEDSKPLPAVGPAEVGPNPVGKDPPARRVEQREPARRSPSSSSGSGKGAKPGTGTGAGSSPGTGSGSGSGSTPGSGSGSGSGSNGSPPGSGGPAEPPPDYVPPSTPPPPIGMGPVKPHPRIILDGSTLSTLRSRAQAGDSAWTRLAALCRSYASGQVEWPDGAKYPTSASGIGEGYQGSGYIDPLTSLGLCYQIMKATSPAEASSIAARGADVLTKMSEPSGGHAISPMRDSGYGIRFYGVAMAIGFDWLYDELSPGVRARVVAALNRWIDAYDRDGFSRNHPQGNYFAGYYAAKGLASLATEGDNSEAPRHWQDFYGRLHSQMVQPYYSQALSGGGWPEGWNYGPRSVFNMWLPALAAKSAKDMDLVGGSQPFKFLTANGSYLIHFTWPSRITLDDRGLQYAAANPSDTDPFLYTTMAGFLERWGDGAAPAFHRFASIVRQRQGTSVEAWAEFLFWNPQAPERDIESLALSHYAPGMEMVAMRSDWTESAVWGAFAAGPYTNNPDSAEQFWDEGGLSIVRGSTPFLVNAGAALVRARNGVNDGDQYGDRIYSELHGGNRSLFNIFYVNSPAPYGQDSYGPSAAKAHIDRFGDAGGYAYARGVKIEDLYRRSQSNRPVTRFTRSVMLVRPRTFVVFDETTIANSANDQWLAFHFPFRPGAASQNGTISVGTGSTFVGAVTPVFPSGLKTQVVNVFESNKTFRLEIRPPSAASSVEWLTVLEATAGTPGQVTPLAVEGGKGVVVGGNTAVVFATAEPSAGTPLRFSEPSGTTRRMIVGLTPGARYTTDTSGGMLTITPGSDVTASSAGVVYY